MPIRYGLGLAFLSSCLTATACKSTSGMNRSSASEIMSEEEVDHESYSPVTGDIMLPKGPETLLTYNPNGPSALVFVDKVPKKDRRSRIHCRTRISTGRRR